MLTVDENFRHIYLKAELWSSKLMELVVCGRFLFTKSGCNCCFIYWIFLGGGLRGGCHLMRFYSVLTVRQSLVEAGNFIRVCSIIKCSFVLRVSACWKTISYSSIVLYFLQKTSEKTSGFEPSFLPCGIYMTRCGYTVC